MCDTPGRSFNTLCAVFSVLFTVNTFELQHLISKEEGQNTVIEHWSHLLFVWID